MSAVIFPGLPILHMIMPITTMATNSTGTTWPTTPILGLLHDGSCRPHATAEAGTALAHDQAARPAKVAITHRRERADREPGVCRAVEEVLHTVTSWHNPTRLFAAAAVKGTATAGRSTKRAGAVPASQS